MPASPRLLLCLFLLPYLGAPAFAAESPLLVPIVHLAAPDLALASPALFVAPDGSDTHEGRSPSAPLATIQRAADLAQPGDTIYLRAGTYRESVRPARSGTEGKPITFASYPGERAVINGTHLVTAPFTKRSGDIYAATLPETATYQSAHNFALQVFVDGEMIHLARWPNLGGDLSRPLKSAITEFISKTRDESARLTTGVVGDDALAAAKIPAVGAEIFFQPNIDAWSWALTGRVTAQSADGGRLTFTSRNDAGKDGGTGYPVGSRYYLFNSPALLDSPGEWYLDRKTRTLGLILPRRDDPVAHRIEIKRRDWAFDLDGLSHLVIRDLDLFACSITTDRAAGGDGIAHEPDGRDRFPWRGRDTFATASDIVLSGLRATYLTHFTDTSGHFYMQWGQGTGIVLSGTRLTLRNSVLRFSAGNGVTVLGRGNRVLNNLILDTAYAAVECAAINTGGAAPTLDHEFACNTIARCGRSGITPRLLANSDPARPAARIHHNDIFHCMLQDWDGGALYAAVTDGKFVRIDHNLAHDIDGFNTSGLYTDFAKNYVFDHNLIWNTEWGFQFQGDARSRGKKVNNTLVYNNTVVVTNTSGAPYGPFNFAGSRGENNGTVIANNLLAVRARTPGWKPFASAYSGAEIADNLIWDGASDAANNPRFADLAATDFALAATSPALGKARPLVPVERDGIAAPPFASDTPANPDLGAFRSGAPVWQAGCNLPERATLAPWGPAVTRGKKR